MHTSPRPRRIAVSIGILARNEESRIPDALASIFRQSIFAELDQRGERAEIWCVANACTDDTASVAARIFQAQKAAHPHSEAFLANAVSVTTPGKINAWNLFVHEISDHQSRCLILMDADIRLGDVNTLRNLARGLEENPAAMVTVGEPVKDVSLQTASLRQRLSLATSRLTQGSGPQMTGQLYCIRAETARAIRLPQDLAACEDGFIKNIVCTDFLRTKTNPRRIVRVAGASHIFEAYTTAATVLKNQKRQMIGQTFVHVLVDKYLPAVLAQEPATRLAEMVEQLDEQDPEWLRRLIQTHVREARHFWKLFPDICSFRFKRWAQLPAGRKLPHLPATLLGTGVTLLAAWMAHRSLRRGAMGYWPQKPPRADAPPPTRLAGGLDFARPAPSG